MRREFNNSGGNSDVPNVLKEALGVLAAAYKVDEEDETQQTSSDEVLALPEGERGSGVLIEKLDIGLYEVSEQARNTLLNNLGLRESDRETMHDEVFYSNRYTVLQARLKELTGDVFGGIHRSNPELRMQISSVLQSKVANNISILNDLTIGMALAIEAYRIDTGSNITAGFAHIDGAAQSTIKEALNFGIPSLSEDAYCFAPAIIDEVAIAAPAGPYRGLVEDIHLIGQLAVERKPLAMRSGAEAILTALGTVWHQVYSPELPGYKPSRYRNDGFIR